MLRLLISVWGIAIILSGCAGHYYKVSDNSVYIGIKEPDAKEVYFLSSLDQYERHEVLKNNRGVWEVSLPSDLEFRYFFIVDGDVFIPPCVQKEKDDFGSENCIFVPEI